MADDGEDRADRAPGLGGAGAVGRGARIIEKHFTLNKGLPGPDHICSATPDEMAELSRLARLMEKIN